jgi:DMSO/TMAO reductase YedYZ molybdopterin-dependent catalytic subunit
MDPSPSSGSADRLLARRDFLRGAALAALPLVLPAAGGLRVWAQAGPGDTRLIPRVQDPENLEGPFAALDSFLTPTDRFYVRNHFAMPKLDVRTWRLRVEGHVRKPLELTYDDLRKIPQRTQVVTLECAGNARSFLTPKPKGVPWELGAVGTAEWTGVPLFNLLGLAGLPTDEQELLRFVRSGAEVLLEGADSGLLKEDPRPQGPVSFARSLPLSRAWKPDVLLALRMNGSDLPPAHGYPLRAIVPGWYGMASVKWLTRIVVLERPFRGYFQTIDYSYWQKQDGLAVLTPITDLQVKAAVARPAPQEVVAANSNYRVHGAAWAGEAEVAKVEVSTDGGTTWAEAKLLDDAVPHAWRRWEYAWRTPAQPGAYTVRARATDKSGRVQATERDPDRRNYMISHVLPIPVTVR